MPNSNSKPKLWPKASWFLSLFCRRVLSAIPHPSLPDATTQLVLPQSSNLLTLALKMALGPKSDSLAAPLSIGNLAPFVQLIEHQRELAQPILVVPTMLVLGKRPANRTKSTIDILFGGRQDPRVFRLLLRIGLFRRSARWEAGEPIDLSGLLSSFPHKSNAELAQALRFRLIKQFRRMEHAFVGPRKKSYERHLRKTLHDRVLSVFLAQQTQDKGVPKADALKKARRYLKEVAANFDIDFIHFMGKLLRLLFNRIYDGIVWDPKDFEKLRKASLKGPIILLPTHKSHIDYLVMSYVMYHEGLMPPHVAAGSNLAFFPVSGLMRKGGAYFIRRTFKGDPLYPQVVRAYVNHLLKEGYTQEFFIEGGRSRSGKTLTPKTGLLSILVDCLTHGTFRDAVFVPAAISYEKLAEAKAFAKELSGGNKKPESATWLVRSTAKLLRGRFGRVFVTIDEPIVLSEFLAKRHQDSATWSLEARERFIKALAHRAVRGMNRCTVVTPTALGVVALFASEERALNESELIALCEALEHKIKTESNNTARFFASETGEVAQLAPAALMALCEDGQLTVSHSGDKRFSMDAKQALILDFYRNNIVQYFAPDGVIADGILHLLLSAESVSVQDLRTFIKSQSQLLKYEYVFPIRPFDEIFHEKLQEMSHNNWIEMSDGRIRLGPAPEGLRQMARLVHNCTQGYRVIERALTRIPKEKWQSKNTQQKLMKLLTLSHQAGRLSTPESASLPLIQNALRAYGEKVL